MSSTLDQLKQMYRDVWADWRDHYDAAPNKEAFMREFGGSVRYIELQRALVGDRPEVSIDGRR